MDLSTSTATVSLPNGNYCTNSYLFSVFEIKFSLFLPVLELKKHHYNNWSAAKRTIWNQEKKNRLLVTDPDSDWISIQDISSNA